MQTKEHGEGIKRVKQEKGRKHSTISDGLRVRIRGKSGMVSEAGLAAGTRKEIVRGTSVSILESAFHRINSHTIRRGS